MSLIKGPMRDTFAVAAILYEALTGKMFMNMADMEYNDAKAKMDLIVLRQEAFVHQGPDSVFRPLFD